MKTDLTREGFVQTGVDLGLVWTAHAKLLLKGFLEASGKYSSAQRGGNGFATQ